MIMRIWLDSEESTRHGVFMKALISHDRLRKTSLTIMVNRSSGEIEMKSCQKQRRENTSILLVTAPSQEILEHENRKNADKLCKTLDSSSATRTNYSASSTWMDAVEPVASSNLLVLNIGPSVLVVQVSTKLGSMGILFEIGRNVLAL